MILILGASVKLLPDTTVFYQLAIFLVVVFFLTIFIFKPIFKILDKRREETTDIAVRVEMIQADTNLLDQEYDEQLASARRDGLAIQQEQIKSGEEEARKIIGTAKKEDKEAATQRRAYIEKETVRAQRDLTKKADDYARLIIAKILGKEPYGGA